MSVGRINGEERITKYASRLLLDVAITAYLLSNTAALSAGFKLAKSDVWS